MGWCGTVLCGAVFDMGVGIGTLVLGCIKGEGSPLLILAVFIKGEPL